MESLYKNDAARQVEVAQRNVLADYGEFYRLKRKNQSLSDINEELKSELNTLSANWLCRQSAIRFLPLPMRSSVGSLYQLLPVAEEIPIRIFVGMVADRTKRKKPTGLGV